MSYQPITFQKVVDIMRKVIGQRDSSSPDATNEILMQYILEFMQLNMPNDIKVQDNWTYYQFNTVADTPVYSFNVDSTQTVNTTPSIAPDQINKKFMIVKPPCWSIDNNAAVQNSIQMYWYQDPQRFYNFWGYIDDTTALTSGQPTDILYYNNQFVLRPMPDAVYEIKMAAYVVDDDFEITDNLPLGYTYRYIAYGAARDYLRDFLDTETLAQIEPAYQEYRELVSGRTAAQNLSKVKQARF